MAFLTKLSKTKKQIDDHLVFEKFGPEHFTEYQDFISRFPQHCDFALNNLMVWMAGNTGLAFCWLNGNIVLRISGSIYENQLDGTWYTVLGDSDADNTLEQLFTWLNTGTLLMVPDYFVSALEHPERYSIVEDADNRDYILDIDTLIQRSGKKYENFRYQISYVIKNYSHESVIKELDLSKEQDVLLIINSMHTWSHITSFADGANDEYKVDAIAIDRLFQLQHIEQTPQHPGIVCGTCRLAIVRREPVAGPIHGDDLERIAHFFRQPFEIARAMGNRVQADKRGAVPAPHARDLCPARIDKLEWRLCAHRRPYG